jgi:hypothetical protein
MVKKFFLAIIIFNFAIILHAQSPLGSRGWELDEQDGYAIVNGKNYHYWLYNIWYYLESGPGQHNDKKYNDVFYDLISDLHRWVERQGWVIDYENEVFYDTSDTLALSVKRLMSSRSRSGRPFDLACEVSVTLDIKSEMEANLIINKWNSMKENMYGTWVYPLIKFE